MKLTMRRKVTRILWRRSVGVRLRQLYLILAVMASYETTAESWNLVRKSSVGMRGKLSG